LALFFPSSHLLAKNQAKLPDRLVAGQTVVNELKGNQIHLYEVLIEAGQFVEATVEQLGINVRVTLLDPNGNTIIESDSHRGLRGLEYFCAIAANTARYRMKVEAVRKLAASGNYRLSVIATRAAMEQDRTHIAAQSLFVEAKRLQQKNDLADWAQARKLYQQAAEQLKVIGDVPRQALALRMLSALSSRYAANAKDLSVGRQAISEAELAVKLYRSLGDRSGEAHSLFTLGEAWSWAMREPERARESYEQALSITREIGERLIEGLLWKSLSQLAYEQNNTQQALDAALRSLEALRFTDELNDIAHSFVQLRQICHVLKDHSQVIAALVKARQIYPEINHLEPDRSALNGIENEARALTNLSLENFALGRFQKAIEQSHEAMLIWRVRGNRPLEADSMLILADIYRETGDKQQALDLLEQATQLFRAAGDSIGETKSLLMSGNVFLLLKEYDAALNHYERAITLSQKSGEFTFEANARCQMAATHRSLGNHSKSVEAYLSCLALARSAKNRPMEAVTLHNLGWTYLSKGDLEKAVAHHEQALQIYREYNDLIGQANSLRGLGQTYAVIGHTSKAIEHHQQAIEFSQAARDLTSETEAHYSLARVYSNANQLPLAREVLEQALKLHEFIRADLLNWEARASYLSSVYQRHEFYIDLLMRMHEQHNTRGHDREAFEACEKSRARSLLESLSAAQTNLRQNAPAALVARETSLQNQISETLLELRKTAQSSEKTVELNRKLTNLRIEWRQVRSEFYKAIPQLAALEKATPLQIAEIQQHLDGETMLLEYSLGSERSYLWVITKDSLHSFALPKADIINQQARKMYQFLSDQQPQKANESFTQWRTRLNHSRDQLPMAIAELSRTVFGPVKPLLGQKRLVIVADGALQYVPFGALMVDSEPLVVNHEIINLPSASTIALLRSQPNIHSAPSGKVIVLADPVLTEDDERLSHSHNQLLNQLGVNKPPGDLISSARETGWLDAEGELRRLPRTKNEAETITRFATHKSSKLILGFDASRKFVMSGALRHYRIVHFATHGLLNSRYPELSGLVLSLFDSEGHLQDGFLRLHDIYNLKLPVDLVVLSACQTALGKEISGEGLIGLTRGFMYAGAPRVVASLWNVDDRATAELMKRFYAEMLGKKQLRPAAALRAAQISMWREQQWNQPYQWAAFVLQGEWR
jgi:CHAT domain-containing protein